MSSRRVTAADVAHGERSATLVDFRAHAPSNTFIYMPCREPWTAPAVDVVVGRQILLDNSGKPIRNKKGELVTESASDWLLKHQRVEQMVWVPGAPALIHDRLIVNGGFIERPEVTCLNMYRPPQIEPGDPNLATPWVDHVRKVFPNDADHILRWLAQRVQFPEIKINHALLLGSETFGIGKDTLLVPVRYAVGIWNFVEIAPTELLVGPFNPFVESIILRINEARDLGEINRFSFYDRLKSYAASPPEVLTVNKKHLRQYAAFNCTGVVITTNHKTDGVYLPSEDRRTYVAWSDCRPEDFSDEYWTKLYAWYENSGNSHVAAYLETLDISAFDPKAPPTKTAVFWEIVAASEPPEDAELADGIDRYGAAKHPGEIAGTQSEQRRPDVLTVLELIGVKGNEMLAYMLEHKNRRAVPHRLNRCGYKIYRNTAAKSGLWRINGTRQTIYVKSGLSESDARAAVAKFLGVNPGLPS